MYTNCIIFVAKYSIRSNRLVPTHGDNEGGAGCVVVVAFNTKIDASAKTVLLKILSFLADSCSQVFGIFAAA